MSRVDKMCYAVYDKVNKEFLTPIFGMDLDSCREFKSNLSCGVGSRTCIIHLGWHEVE